MSMKGYGPTDEALRLRAMGPVEDVTGGDASAAVAIDFAAQGSCKAIFDVAEGDPVTVALVVSATEDFAVSTELLNRTLETGTHEVPLSGEYVLGFRPGAKFIRSEAWGEGSYAARIVPAYC